MSVETLLADRPQQQQAVQAEAQAIRIWPAFAILAIQVVALALTVTPAINNGVRFGFMMLGPTVCAILFAGWLMLASRMRWRDRVVILLGVILGAILSSLLIDSSMGVTLWIYGVPLALGLTTVVLWLGKNRPPRVRTRFVLAAVACGWGLFLLARLEGFNGSYWPEMQFRWTPSQEQLLVASASSTGEEPTGTEPIQAVSDSDWPGFRGSHRDSRIEHGRIETDWNTSPPRELWRIPVGPAWSSFASVGNHLFTQEQRGDQEVVVCYNADSGKEVWRHSDAARFSEVVSGAGPRATPTFAEGRLYTLGGRGMLNCLDAARGTLHWQHDLVSEIDAKMPIWGFAASPLMVGRQVIVYAGGSRNRGVVAYDTVTGELKWSVPLAGMNYSSPQLVTLCDQPLVLMASTRLVLAIQPETGEVVWKFSQSGQRSMAVVQPQQLDSNSLIIPHGDGGGLSRIDVQLVDKTWNVSESWTSRNLKPSFNDFVYFQGHLYGFDQNIFTCIDAQTGQRRWKRGRYGFGQVILFAQQGLLLIVTEQGEVVLLKADPDGHEELARIKALSGKTWNHPIFAGNRLFLRNSAEAVCFEIPTGSE